MNLPSPTPFEPTPDVARAATLGRDGSPPAPLPRSSPVTIPRHRIIGEIGSGGMGSVYEARNSLDNVVALKIIRPDRVGQAFIVRFREEARAMQQLRHPHIPRLFDYDVVDGWPYFTMDLIRGGTLADHLPTFRDRIEDAVALMIKVVDAVAYLHEQGKLHRDLKPQNILVDESGEPYVTDFGLVKEFDPLNPPPLPTPLEEPTTPSTIPFSRDDATRFSPRLRAGLEQSLTATGAQLGTRPYMSPEQVDGRKDDIDRRTDIWALGVILYELVAQSRPFGGPTVTILEDAIRAAEPDPPLKMNVSTHAELNRIIGRCLAKRREDRYTSARELKADLQHWYELTARGPFWTRRRMLFAAAGGVTALAGLATGLQPSPKPAQDLIRDQFRLQGRVTLLGTDQPRWYEIMGPGGAWLEPVDGVHGFTSNRTTLVELARGLEKPGFRFSASLRFEELKGQFALYIGRRGFDKGTTTRHVLLAAILSPWAKRDALTFSVGTFILGDRIEATQLPKIKGQDTLPGEPLAEMKLTYEVRPESITVLLNDRLFHSIPRINLQRLVPDLNRGRQGWEDVTPTFDLGDGIGFYLHGGGRVRLREITLEQLDPLEPAPKE